MKRFLSICLACLVLVFIAGGCQRTTGYDETLTLYNSILGKSLEESCDILGIGLDDTERAMESAPATLKDPITYLGHEAIVYLRGDSKLDTISGYDFYFITDNDDPQQAVDIAYDLLEKLTNELGEPNTYPGNYVFRETDDPLAFFESGQGWHLWDYWEEVRNEEYAEIAQRAGIEEDVGLRLALRLEWHNDSTVHVRLSCDLSIIYHYNIE